VLLVFFVVCSWSVCWHWQLLWPDWNTRLSALPWTQYVFSSLCYLSTYSSMLYLHI